MNTSKSFNQIVCTQFSNISNSIDQIYLKISLSKTKILEEVDEAENPSLDIDKKKSSTKTLKKDSKTEVNNKVVKRDSFLSKNKSEKTADTSTKLTPKEYLNQMENCIDHIRKIIKDENFWSDFMIRRHKEKYTSLEDLTTAKQSELVISSILKSPCAYQGIDLKSNTISYEIYCDPKPVIKTYNEEYDFIKTSVETFEILPEFEVDEVTGQKNFSFMSRNSKKDINKNNIRTSRSRDIVNTSHKEEEKMNSMDMEEDKCERILETPGITNTNSSNNIVYVQPVKVQAKTITSEGVRFASKPVLNQPVKAVNNTNNFDITRTVSHEVKPELKQSPSKAEYKIISQGNLLQGHSLNNKRNLTLKIEEQSIESSTEKIEEDCLNLVNLPRNDFYKESFVGKNILSPIASPTSKQSNLYKSMISRPIEFTVNTPGKSEYCKKSPNLKAHSKSTSRKKQEEEKKKYLYEIGTIVEKTKRKKMLNFFDYQRKDLEYFQINVSIIFNPRLLNRGIP